MSTRDSYESDDAMRNTPRDPLLARAYRDAVQNESAPSPALDDAIRAAARRAVQAKPSTLDAPAHRPLLQRWQTPLALAASLVLAIGVAVKVYDTGEADIQPSEKTARLPSPVPSPAPPTEREPVAPAPTQTGALEQQRAEADAGKAPAAAGPGSANVQELAKAAQSAASSTNAAQSAASSTNAAQSATSSTDAAHSAASSATAAPAPEPSQPSPARPAIERDSDRVASPAPSSAPEEKLRRQERANDTRARSAKPPADPAPTDAFAQRRDAERRARADGGGGSEAPSAVLGGGIREAEAPVTMPRAFPGSPPSSSPPAMAPAPQAMLASPPAPAPAPPPPSVTVAPKPTAPPLGASAPANEGALRERSTMKVEPAQTPSRQFGERLEDRPQPQGRIAAAPKPAESRAKQLESRPAPEWIDEIRSLRRAERIAEANELLAAFKQRFPELELPDDLR